MKYVTCPIKKIIFSSEEHLFTCILHLFSPLVNQISFFIRLGNDRIYLAAFFRARFNSILPETVCAPFRITARWFASTVGQIPNARKHKRRIRLPSPDPPFPFSLLTIRMARSRHNPLGVRLISQKAFSCAPSAASASVRPRSWPTQIPLPDVFAVLRPESAGPRPRWKSTSRWSV